jgi:anti-anti-sigma regulatory factor
MFSWRHEPCDRGPVFHLTGCIDERAELLSMVPEISGVIYLDFAGVERFNSSGIMRWFEFFERVMPKADEIHFVRCSVSVVNHLNMIRNFAPGVWIDSFFAPYFCESCVHGEDHLIEISAHHAKISSLQAPAMACTECGEPLLFDSLEITYFTFLNEAALRFPVSDD